MLAVAVTETGAGDVKVRSPLDVVPASSERPLLARATVTPTAAPAPMAMLTVFTVTACVPSAVIVRPPEPTEPCAPEVAFSVPLRSANAIAALRPTPTPPLTETTNRSEVMLSWAVTEMPLTAPEPPTATLPIVALALPFTLTTPTAAPAAMPPTATPIA